MYVIFNVETILKRHIRANHKYSLIYNTTMATLQQLESKLALLQTTLSKPGDPVTLDRLRTVASKIAQRISHLKSQNLAAE